MSSLPTQTIRSRKRSISVAPPALPNVPIKKKKEPKFTSFKEPDSYEEELVAFKSMHSLWSILRDVNSNDQVVPAFSGFGVQDGMKEKTTVEYIKTKLTYLPPIDASITDFSTIYKLFEVLLLRAEKNNMPYVNLTLDAGAYVNAYRVLTNYPEKFAKIVLHLGDLHFMKESFTILGTLVKGSGFEDVVFQAGVCSTGSLNGVLSSSHYNRCWTVHSVIGEAIERLCLELFLKQGNAFPGPVQMRYEDLPNCLELLTNESEITAFIDKYKQFKVRIRNGEHGKTAQSWLVYYLDILSNISQIHHAVQTNDFGLRHDGLKKILPFCFVLNKQNYARYGSIYVHNLANIDITHPGCKQLLLDKGLSVQAQSRSPLRTSIDQRGKQTVNRDAKTSGGIKSFASNNDSILKWTLNRSYQAENMQALYEMAGIKRSTEDYKCTRPSQIIKSEHRVTKLKEILGNEFPNPFDPSLENEYLFNIGSGIPVDKDLAEAILAMKDKGEDLCKVFLQNRILSTKEKIHNPIKRQEKTLFQNSSKKVTVKQSGKEKVIEVNREIIGRLLALSAKHEKLINFEIALQYPLCPVPRSLVNPDGSRRKTTKSALMKVVRSYESSTDEEETTPPKQNSAFLVDLTALIRTISPIPATYAELVKILIDRLLKGYRRIDIIPDTYRMDYRRVSRRRRRNLDC